MMVNHLKELPHGLKNIYKFSVANVYYIYDNKLHKFKKIVNYEN